MGVLIKVLKQEKHFGPHTWIKTSHSGDSERLEVFSTLSTNILELIELIVLYINPVIAFLKMK